jgi:hypothetical protein
MANNCIHAAQEKNEALQRMALWCDAACYAVQSTRHNISAMVRHEVVEHMR